MERSDISGGIGTPCGLRCLLLLAIIAVVGCNGSFKNVQLAPKPPVSAPPTNPAPIAVQSGSVTISPQYIALAPGQSYQFTATVAGGGQVQWFVAGSPGGNSTSGTIDGSGKYTAPAAVSQSENIAVSAALGGSSQTNYATAIVAIILPGQVSCPDATHNPLVALDSIYLPAPGKASVEFGTTTAYGLNTWQVPTPSLDGGGVQIWVAGMKSLTQYHMRAQVVLDNGATYNDQDTTCTTGVAPATSAVQITANGLPQSGIELWNTILPNGDTQAFATDLSGNVIWTYSYQEATGEYIQGIKLLPDGNMLMTISYLSSLKAPPSTGAINEVREVDLDGNTIRSLTMPQLNAAMTAGNFRDAAGNVYQFTSFHHDVLPLPNGHWVVLATYKRQFTNLQGTTGSTTVIGDALIDVDQNLNPDWVWNSFDHLDINRRPMNFPDWTHSNGLLYSSDDHNLLLSMRHQNWVIKINFLDGKGSGDVMWRLGEGGDFKLVGATDPTDWFYAQHGMSYFTQNTTGVFRIGMMDNGNDRIFPSGSVYCQPYAPSTAQCYSTMPVLELNESTMTATMIRHYVPPDYYFTFFGGNAELLKNGDMEVNFCSAVKGAIVEELDPSGSQKIWRATTPNADQFHVYRLPSLYPGVQW